MASNSRYQPQAAEHPRVDAHVTSTYICRHPAVDVRISWQMPTLQSNYSWADQERPGETRRLPSPRQGVRLCEHLTSRPRQLVFLGSESAVRQGKD